MLTSTSAGVLGSSAAAEAATFADAFAHVLEAQAMSVIEGVAEAMVTVVLLFVAIRYVNSWLHSAWGGDDDDSGGAGPDWGDFTAQPDIEAQIGAGYASLSWAAIDEDGPSFS